MKNREDKQKWSFSLFHTQGFERKNKKWAINKFSPRPSYVNLDLLELKRSIYKVRYLKAIKNNDLVINIDECTLPQDTYCRKSWSSKGKEQN